MYKKSEQSRKNNICYWNNFYSCNNIRVHLLDYCTYQNLRSSKYFLFVAELTYLSVPALFRKGNGNLHWLGK